MGIFQKAKDSRIQQIISRELGPSFDIQETGAGSFFCHGLNINIKPFYAALGDIGIAFINKAEVVLVLKWDEIYSFKKKSTQGGVELVFWAPIEGNANVWSKEPPFRFFHNATILFNENIIADKSVALFKKSKIEEGFSEDSLVLHESWMNWGINEPITLDKFHEANKDWATKEIREQAYEVWGEFLDSERFLYFVGRGVCAGKLPSDLVHTALEEYKLLNTENSKFTLKNKLPDEKTMKIIDDTSSLKLFDEGNEISEWFMVTVDVQYQEWTGNMPIKKRRAAAKLSRGENDWTLLEVHNDFHKATTFPTLNWNPKKSPNKIDFGGNFVTFREQDVARLKSFLSSS